MKNKTCIISGHSGVGKSTLINSISPKLKLKTKEISSSHNQGKHTTTFAEMHPLKSGGFIIDTPGIRAFGIVDLDKSVISHYFPEMRDRMADCKFNNCLHKEEPHCAVKKALDEDKITWSRYQSYLKILEGDEEQYRNDIYGEDRIASDETRK